VFDLNRFILFWMNLLWLKLLLLLVFDVVGVMWYLLIRLMRYCMVCVFLGLVKVNDLLFFWNWLLFELMKL